MSNEKKKEFARVAKALMFEKLAEKLEFNLDDIPNEELQELMGDLEHFRLKIELSSLSKQLKKLDK